MGDFIADIGRTAARVVEGLAGPRRPKRPKVPEALLDGLSQGHKVGGSGAAGALENVAGSVGNAAMLSALGQGEKEGKQGKQEAPDKESDKKGGKGAARFDREKFAEEYTKAFKGKPPAPLLDLLGIIEAEGSVSDLRQVAYMLATVKHETAHTYLPIEEYGKGRGYAYGKKVAGKVYFGRGYVQLTWRDNYLKLGEKLGLGTKLADDPELALKPDVAFRIMVVGMREGLFTTKALGDYIGGGKADYVNARRVINGLDKANTIAGYAKKFEKALTAAEGAAKLPKPDKPPTAAPPGGV